MTFRRPQTPVPPYPYTAEEIAFDNLAGDAHLAGTLTIPFGSGPFPAALLITGSGQHDRDESVFGHKPFLIWADFLTRRGIAVLRVDDRGVGGSTGDARVATTADFAGDVASALDFLRSRSEVDTTQVGLIGHSEGAVIAQIAAARDPLIRYIVLIAGMGVTGEALLLEQKRLIEASEGIPAGVIEVSCERLQLLFASVKAAASENSANAALQEAWARIAPEEGEDPLVVPPAIEALASPWMRWFLRYDPRPDLAKVSCSVLAVTGANDLQTPARSNLAGIREALRANKDAIVIELPGLNHLLQTSPTGRLAEYEQIEETVSPDALHLVTNWIVDRTTV